MRLIQLARPASLLLAFYLLISAATAHAECAWVLWSELRTRAGAGEPQHSHGWEISVAFPSARACDDGLTSSVRQQTALSKALNEERPDPGKIVEAFGNEVHE